MGGVGPPPGLIWASGAQIKPAVFYVMVADLKVL